MKDIFLSVFKTSEERLKNPFIGTFIISFIAFNWKAIAVFFLSNLTVEERINSISSDYSNICNLLIYPLLISLIYIVVIPYLMWIFEILTFKSYKERNQNLYKNKIIDINGKKTVAVGEIELENLKADYKEKADLNAQIQSLKAQIFNIEIDSKIKDEKLEELSNENSELKHDLNKKENSIDDLYRKLEDTELRTKNYYEEYSNTPKNTITDFVKNINLINSLNNKDNSQYLIDRFIAQGLIAISKGEYRLNGVKTEYFEITDKGLYFIKRANSDKII